MSIFFFAAFAAEAGHEVAKSWDSPGVILLKLLAIVFLVLLNGFFVASEFAIVKIRSSKLETLVDQGVRGAAFARHVVAHLDAYLSATQLGITLASLGLGWLGEPFLAAMLEPFFVLVGVTSERAIGWICFFIAFSIITALHIILGELVPKSLAIRLPVPTTLAIARPLGIFYMVFKPLIWVLNGIANAFLRKVLKVEPVSESELVHSEEELRVILSEGQKTADDEVTSLGNELLINALDLKRRVVRDIMTPRGEVVYLDLEAPFDEEVKEAIQSRHTRFPLCRGHLDDASGLVHIKDLLVLIVEGKKDLVSIQRDLLHVSETMPLERLLRFFLNKHAHLAVAVDEYGGAVGIVTLDNVLEELVGAIQDEFDVAEQEVQQINELEFDADGATALYELAEMTGLNFDTTDVSTIGGYVTAELGHLPVKGEYIRAGNYTVTVKECDGRRVIRVHFRRDPELPLTADDEKLKSER